MSDNELSKQDTASLNRLDFTVEDATEWSRLFYRNHGWFGGDGIFCVTMKGSEKNGAAASDTTLMWFSDTMLGDIEGDSLQPGFEMINNSIAIIANGKPDSTTTRFIWDKTTDGKAKGLFIPNTPATKTGDYYWLGDGFVNHAKNNDIYIFGYRIRTEQASNTFGFREVGNTLITIPAGSQPPYANKRQVDIPFYQDKLVDSTGSFGAGVLVNTEQAGATRPDGYVYIYGVKGKNKNVIVARVQPAAIESFDQWTFWDGKNWSGDPASVQPVADRASNERSVTPLPDGRYIMIFQTDGIGKQSGMRLGRTPSGHFGPIINILDVSDKLEKDKDIFPYNAKAHPVLSAPGELLISFNVNSFDFFNDIKTFPHLYRPRFIRLKYDLN